MMTPHISKKFWKKWPFLLCQMEALQKFGFCTYRTLVNVLTRVTGAKHFTAWHSSLTETVELLQSEPSDWIKYLGSAERNVFLCEAQPEQTRLCNLHSARDSLLPLQLLSMVPVTQRNVSLNLACWVWLPGLSLQNSANNSPHAHLRILYARHNSSVNVMLHSSCFPKVHVPSRWNLPWWSAAERELPALCLKKSQQNPNFPLLWPKPSPSSDLAHMNHTQAQHGAHSAYMRCSVLMRAKWRYLLKFKIQFRSQNHGTTK